MSEIYIDALYSYPVKSCAPLHADEHEVTEQGLQFDREWVVTRPNGTFLSQRNVPELALVKPDIVGDELVLRAPSAGSVSIPLERDPAKEAQAEPIVIFEKEGTAYVEGDEACDFLSDFLGKEVLLKRSVRPRPINPAYQKDGASSSSKHADGFPLMMTSTASLELFNAYAGQGVPMSRFRPNIVVTGENLAPYAEDYWREARIGQMRSYIVKACARCPIPDVDQLMGRRDEGRLVNRILRETRSGTFYGKDKAEVFFGQNLLHIAEPGLRLRVGDPVVPARLSSRRNFNLLSAA